MSSFKKLFKSINSLLTNPPESREGRIAEFTRAVVQNTHYQICDVLEIRSDKYEGTKVEYFVRIAAALRNTNAPHHPVEKLTESDLQKLFSDKSGEMIEYFESYKFGSNRHSSSNKSEFQNYVKRELMKRGVERKPVDINRYPLTSLSSTRSTGTVDDLRQSAKDPSTPTDWARLLAFEIVHGDSLPKRFGKPYLKNMRSAAIIDINGRHRGRLRLMNKHFIRGNGVHFTDFDEADEGLSLLLASVVSSMFYDEPQKPHPGKQGYVQIQEIKPSLGGIVGRSKQMREVQDRIKSYAPSALPVLVTGNPGTGKKLVAAAIHSLSPRKSYPFVAVDCSVLTTSEIASELFGISTFAHQGAGDDNRSSFESASGGTLFIDRIEKLTFELQGQLFRVMKNMSIIGPKTNIDSKVDFRLLTGTEDNLLNLIEHEKFSNDLYRLICANTQINLPSLVERTDDIPDLVSYFLCQEYEEHKKVPPVVSEQFMDSLIRYHFPYNVLELEQILKTVCVLTGWRSTLETADLELLPQFEKVGKAIVSLPHEEKGTLSEFLKAEERRVIGRTLRRTGGNVSAAGKILNVDRSNLLRKAKEYGLLGPEKDI